MRRKNNWESFRCLPEIFIQPLLLQLHRGKEEWLMILAEEFTLAPLEKSTGFLIAVQVTVTVTSRIDQLAYTPSENPVGEAAAYVF